MQTGARKGFGIGLILLSLALILTGCGEDHTWRQKLTLVIDTPAGEVSGSSVIAIDARFFAQSMGNEVEYDVTGEAVVVEVLPGKYLFALLGEPSELFYYAARGRFSGLDRGAWLSEIPRQTEPVTLTDKTIPMLVTFEDINRPETLMLVDPSDLAATFGPGVSLKAATLEITRESVTEGRVEGVLPWLEAVGRARGTLIPNPPRLSTDLTNPEIQLLGPSSFSTELFK